MCSEVCPYCLRIADWRWVEVQEMVTTVGFELQFNFVVVYHSKGWHHCDLVIVIATYLHSNHHRRQQQQQYGVRLCAENLYVTANSGCNFQSYHIWVIKQVQFSRQIDCRLVVFVLCPVFWVAFLSSVSWPHSTPSKFIFILCVTISV